MSVVLKEPHPFAFVAVYQRSLAETRSTDWDTLVHHFVEDYFVAHPDFAVRAGRHAFDGKLPDWSRAGLAKEAERLDSNRKRAVEFDPAKLDRQQRFERDYLIAVIDRDLFWLTSARWAYKNPMAYASALDPNVYVARAYAPLDARMRAYVHYAKALPNAVKQIRSNLRTPLPHSRVAFLPCRTESSQNKELRSSHLGRAHQEMPVGAKTHSGQRCCLSVSFGGDAAQLGDGEDGSLGRILAGHHENS